MFVGYKCCDNDNNEELLINDVQILGMDILSGTFWMFYFWESSHNLSCDASDFYSYFQESIKIRYESCKELELDYIISALLNGILIFYTMVIPSAY